MKLMNNDKSTTSGPASLLQSIHLVPAPRPVVDNDKHRRHVKKQISPDLKSGEKTKLSTRQIDKHVANNSETPPCRLPPVWDWS
jgi:hypothetical protein